MIGNRYLSMLGIEEPSKYARDADSDGPQHPAEHVEDDERAVAHLADACEDRRERAHHRDEASEEDRLRAVVLEEVPGARRTPA